MKLKNILLTSLSFVLVAALAVGGTIAYLTDTDSAVNVMTVGNVKIEQVEYERNANGELTDFTQAKPALPAVYDTEDWADNGVEVNGTEYKVFSDNMKNVVDKIVTVNNTGKSDAYVRTIVAIEAPDYDPEDLIHINYNGTDVKISDTVKVEIDGVKYVVFAFTYNEALAAGEKSAPSLMQLFLDKDADNDFCAKFGDTFDILVLSQAVQSAGFESAQTALDTAFGDVTADKVAEWFGGIVIPTIVQSNIVSNSTGYGYFTANGEMNIFNDVDIVTSGGGISVWGTAEFNSGSIVTNSTSTNPRHVFYVACDKNQANGYLTINDGEFTFSPSNLTRKGYYICADGEGAVVIVNGGTFGKPSTRDNYKAGIGELNGGEVIIKGGTFGFNPSNWVADGYEAVQNGNTWTVSAK